MLTPVQVLFVDRLEGNDDAAVGHGRRWNGVLLQLAEHLAVRRGRCCGAVDLRPGVADAVQPQHVRRLRIEPLVYDGERPAQARLPREALTALAVVLPDEMR
jgi:hypothetical protein